MSIPIIADHFCVSADEPAVRLQLLTQLLEQLTDDVITVATADPDGVTLTVAGTRTASPALVALRRRVHRRHAGT